MEHSSKRLQFEPLSRAMNHEQSYTKLLFGRRHALASSAPAPRAESCLQAYASRRRAANPWVILRSIGTTSVSILPWSPGGIDQPSLVGVLYLSAMDDGKSTSKHGTNAAE